MRDTLNARPLPNESVILNLDSAEGRGTHWVCFVKREDTAIYFDPYGNLPPPLEVMKYLHNCKILYNRDRVQNTNWNCGHLCVEFLYKME